MRACAIMPTWPNDRGIYSFHPASCRKYDHTHQLVPVHVATLRASVSIISNKWWGCLISWALEELAIKLHKPPDSPFQFSNQTMLPTLAVDV